MATFSVADLTAKSKKTMSKNDKKVIDKYKITSAYESKKGLNQKKRETAKENKVETKATKPETKSEDKKIEETSLEVDTKVESPANVETKNEKIEGTTINIEETTTKAPPHKEENTEHLPEKERKEAQNEDIGNDVIVSVEETAETSINNTKLKDSGSVEEIKNSTDSSKSENISIEDDKKSIETVEKKPEIIPEVTTESIKPVEIAKEELTPNFTNEHPDNTTEEFLYQDYTIDNIEFDVIESSYVEPEMKEIMQTNDSVSTEVDKKSDFMVTSVEQDDSNLDNITKKDENLAKSDMNVINTLAKEENDTTPNNTDAPIKKEQVISEISDNKSDEGNVEEETVFSTSINVENDVKFENESDEEIDDEDDDNSFTYGEADPNQFVYYHRKDIRLKFHTGEKRRQLLESIRANGIHEPILVRQGPNDKLEIIAGHNRQDIAKELGIKVPYILLQNVDDDTADQICVDTNLLNRQHNDMLPSELSNMLAVKRKMFTLERLSEEFHIANTTMKSFLKLQDLLPELLYDWVDTKKIGMTVGYTIACADRNQQHDLLNYLNENNIKSISVKQGKEISNRGKLPWDKEFLDKVFNNEIDFSNVKPQTKVSITFKELGKYMGTSELKDPKKTLYNMLSMKKKADSMLAEYNMEYSEDIVLEALKQYIENKNF